MLDLSYMGNISTAAHACCPGRMGKSDVRAFARRLERQPHEKDSLFSKC